MLQKIFNNTHKHFDKVNTNLTLLYKIKNNHHILKGGALDEDIKDLDEKGSLLSNIKKFEDKINGITSKINSLNEKDEKLMSTLVEFVDILKKAYENLQIDDDDKDDIKSTVLNSLIETINQNIDILTRTKKQEEEQIQSQQQGGGDEENKYINEIYNLLDNFKNIVYNIQNVEDIKDKINIKNNVINGNDIILKFSKNIINNLTDLLKIENNEKLNDNYEILEKKLNDYYKNNNKLNNSIFDNIKDYFNNNKFYLKKIKEIFMKNKIEIEFLVLTEIEKNLLEMNNNNNYDDTSYNVYYKKFKELDKEINKEINNNKQIKKIIDDNQDIYYIKNNIKIVLNKINDYVKKNEEYLIKYKDNIKQYYNTFQDDIKNILNKEINKTSFLDKINIIKNKYEIINNNMKQENKENEYNYIKQKEKLDKFKINLEEKVKQFDATAMLNNLSTADLQIKDDENDPNKILTNLLNTKILKNENNQDFN